MPLLNAIHEFHAYVDEKLKEYAPYKYKDKRCGTIDRAFAHMTEYSQNLNSFNKDLNSKSEEIVHKLHIEEKKVFFDKLVDFNVNLFVEYYNK